MDTTILTNLLGYKTQVTLFDGSTLDGGDKVSGGSVISPNPNNSTIAASVVKAAYLFKSAMEGTAPLIKNTYNGVEHDCTAAIWDDANSTIVEVCNGEETFDLAYYNKQNGKISAGTLEQKSNVIRKFEVGYGKRNGTCILLSMFPTLLQDAEAQATFSKLTGTLQDRENLGILSDNIYFRIKSKDVPLQMTERPNGSSVIGVPNLIKQQMITTGSLMSKLEESATLYGTPEIFVRSTSKKPIKGAVSILNVAGQYLIDPSRILNEAEKQMVPTFDDGHKCSAESVKVAKLICKSTATKRPFRNVMLEGPAGTGKSMMCKEVAAALGIPYTHFSCEPFTESLLGTMIPNPGAIDKATEELDLPTPDDCRFDLETSYFRLTGKKEVPFGFDADECINLLFVKLTEHIRATGSEGQDFIYVPSEIAKALKEGYACEIQEARILKHPEVLASLNDITDINSGIVQLPTGEIFKRDPRCVLFFTSNKDYEGCNDMNQSVVSRMQYYSFVQAPSDTELTQRAMHETDIKNPVLVKQCIEVMHVINDYLNDNQIDDGVCGPRELFDWLQTAYLLDDVAEAAETTIINKATGEDDIREYLIHNFIETTEFATTEL